jgi:hypothetical protein
MTLLSWWRSGISAFQKNEVLETTEEYLNKKRTISFKEVIPGDEVFIKLKKNT